MKRTALTGYRVDILVELTKLYSPYTSSKLPLTLEMAHAYRAHLERGDGKGRSTGGRIVELPGGATVEEWEGKHG